MPKLREGGFLISKIKQMSGRIFDKKLKQNRIENLNNGQGRIIFVLWRNNDIPITELAKETALSKTTLTSMLDRLEKAGHIKRNIDDRDKRKTLVSLTEKSKLIKEKYFSVSHEMIGLFYKGLSNQQVDDFENTLQHILNNLGQYEKGQK